jgi:hypothetical protein
LPNARVHDAHTNKCDSRHEKQRDADQCWGVREVHEEESKDEENECEQPTPPKCGNPPHEPNRDLSDAHTHNPNRKHKRTEAAPCAGREG